MAPRNRFAVGSLPGKPRILLAAACSGHGFKFAPAIGAAIADLATGTERPDLEFIAPAALVTSVRGRRGSRRVAVDLSLPPGAVDLTHL